MMPRMHVLIILALAAVAAARAQDTSGAPSPPPPVEHPASASAAAPAFSIDALAFLTGHWSAEGPGGSSSEELWLPPKSGLMVGLNRSVSRKGRVSFEFLRVEQRENAVAYVAQPGGGKPTAFLLTRAEGQLAVFENPEHDFPRRITYRRHGTALHARVDDGTDGSHGIEFAWTLVADGAAASAER